LYGTFEFAERQAGTELETKFREMDLIKESVCLQVRGFHLASRNLNALSIFDHLHSVFQEYRRTLDPCLRLHFSVDRFQIPGFVWEVTAIHAAVFAPIHYAVSA